MWEGVQSVYCGWKCYVVHFQTKSVYECCVDLCEGKVLSVRPGQWAYIGAHLEYVGPACMQPTLHNRATCSGMKHMWYEALKLRRP